MSSEGRVWRCLKKGSWRNLRYFPGVWLEGLSKMMQTTVRVAGVRPVFERGKLPAVYSAEALHVKPVYSVYNSHGLRTLLSTSRAIVDA